MKKINDLKTGAQLFIGFGVVTVLILTLSVVAWLQTDKMALQTEGLYDHPLQVRRALGSFETKITAIHRDMRGLMLTGSEQEVEELLTQLEINKADAFRQLDIMEARYLGPPSDITTLRAEFVKWNTIREETIRLFRQGNLKEAADRTKPGGAGSAQAQRLYEKTSVVDEFARNKGDQFYQDSQQLKKDLNLQLMIFTMFAFTISVFFAFWLSWIINSPIKVIARAIDSYRSGNKASRSAFTSKNLLGKLSASFNEMAATIESESLISQNAAELSGIMLSQNDVSHFCNSLLKNLLEQTGSQMGAVYLLNDDHTLFECFASLGLEDESGRSFSAIHPEGEFGLVLATRKITRITDIPADSHFSFPTVAGYFKPREIVTIPIFNGDKAVALISLFSIKNYSEISLRLIESIFDTLTARMNGILAFRQILEQARQLEKQNRELDVQKKELEIMADELTEQNSELEAQKYQLGEVNRLKTNFLSSMSHELRTPLNSVIALSGVLNRRLAQKVGEEEYSFIGVIERNGRQLLKLINDVLDLSRIEAGKAELEKKTFSVSALLNDIVSMIKPQADNKGIALNFNEDSTTVVVESDYDKCFHIFQNIISNAVKFTENGSVDIRVSTGMECAVVQISDTGIGISDADLSYIFDEFRQADGSNSRKFGGTGLGLSIAKKYCELLGCKINVTSELGQGSVFTVNIPVKAGYSARESMSISPGIMQGMPQKHEKTRAEGKNILLVEDTEAMIIQISDILEAEGYTVKAAKNGFEALDYLESSIPDAVILDLMMPGMDGFEVLNKIRRRKQTSELPVLVLTAKILDREELIKIENNHVHQLVQKGKITQESLLEAIALLMLKKEATTSHKQIEVAPVSVKGKPVILAVEDNADNMVALKALTGDHFRLIEATNGAEGIEKAQKHMPHLILMDIAMPGMNGFEALKAIRKDDNLKHTPVIVVTSSAMRGDRNYFLDYGFNGYVSKPINSELLFEEMHKWLKIKSTGEGNNDE